MSAEPRAFFLFLQLAECFTSADVVSPNHRVVAHFGRKVAAASHFEIAPGLYCVPDVSVERYVRSDNGSAEIHLSAKGVLYTCHAIENKAEENNEPPCASVVILRNHRKVVAEIEIRLLRIGGTKSGSTQMENLGSACATCHNAHSLVPQSPAKVYLFHMCKE